MKVVAQLNIDVQHKLWLEEQSKKQDKSMAKIVREILDKEMKNNN